MQNFFRLPSLDYSQTFRQALIEIIREGQEVRPRGMLTKEIAPATMVVDPRKTLYFSKERNLNFAFLLAENLWYLSGRSDTHFLSFYNSKIKSFSEDGLHDGAYGPKIVGQIRYVIETLKNDPDSRQAIVSLWRENPRPSKDVPCTSLFQFMIRDSKLNMYVTMRSNDIIWGSNYDVPSFALIQIVMASCLGIPPGQLYHTGNSLHLYETHFDLAERLALEEVVYKAELPICMPMSLEEHTQQWDKLGSIEGCMRNFDDKAFNAVAYHVEKLDIFYQNYALVFAWYHAMKRKDTMTMNCACIELANIKSPFFEWYRQKTEEIKAKK